MYPWMFFWAPHLQFPLSGNVTQDIDPIFNLFRPGRAVGSGTPDIERKAFDVASYGQQLGWITEVLLELAQEKLAADGQGAEALQNLKRVQEKIETIKKSHRDQEIDQIERQIQAIYKRGGADAAELAKRIRALKLPPVA